LAANEGVAHSGHKTRASLKSVVNSSIWSPVENASGNNTARTFSAAVL